MELFGDSRRVRQGRARFAGTPTRLFAGVAIAAAWGLVLATPSLALLPDEGSVSPTAATGIPELATNGTDGSIERVLQLVPCDDTMYAVGLFTEIRRNSSFYPRDNAFSFNATSGAMTSWAPAVNGQVNTVALSADCSIAYLGGKFSSVNGTAVKNLAAVSTTTGAVTDFLHTAGGVVHNLVLSDDHLLVGGRFTSINGSTKDYLVSLDSTTGRDDSYVDLNISGKYEFTDQGGQQSRSNVSQVYNMDLSPDGSKLLAMGVFTSVGGQPRKQIFMLDLGATSATVNPWYSPEFDQHCAVVQPFYLRAASWAPDMSKVYVATTGYKPASGIGYRTSEPRGGLCDAVAAFSSGPSATQSHLWINYTGCDSLYSTAADSGGVYAGGHQRWMDSPVQCDGNNNGTKVVAPGLTGLDPDNGVGLRSATNPTVGKYHRGRGVGATDMFVTSEGLWIASDNAQNTDSCGKNSDGSLAHGHSGICFLPY